MNEYVARSGANWDFFRDLVDKHLRQWPWCEAGEYLRDARVANGWTQRDLVAFMPSELHFTRGKLQRCEKGLRALTDDERAAIVYMIAGGPPVSAWNPEGLPEGLCGDKRDHTPHRVDYAPVSNGPMWCHADQRRRLPYRLDKEKKV